MDTVRSVCVFCFRTQGVRSWQLVSDEVMGGLSDGHFDPTDSGRARFSGTLSLKNNGGFCAVRTSNMDFGFAPFEGVVLRVNGDGRSYQFRVRNHTSLNEISYRAIFDTETDQWVTVRIPFRSMSPVFRGRTISGQPLVDPSKIQQIGFLIADKKMGRFRLDVDWIKAYSGNPERLDFLSPEAPDSCQRG